MSVVGFDVGNENGRVAVARQRGIDVVLNEESKRESPMLACFGDKQRFLGVAGAAGALMNTKNTVSQIKRFIGRRFSDPEVQRDLPLFPFPVTEGPDGLPLINVTFCHEKRTFTPTQILAMLLSYLKSIAEQNLGATVSDCVLGIPSFFTDAQRRAYLDAASIAGLNPLRLMHEDTATALSYGIYKTDLPETEPLYVAFVDVGHAHMQVTVSAFKKGQLKILSHSFDRCLGGRDFDAVLFEHFADQFKADYKIDIRTNARAQLRLRAGCEKLKKVLSANAEAPLNIECLMDEKDVRSRMTRELFEELSFAVLERVEGPLKKALEESGLTREQISVVEVVGSGSRVPALMKKLGSFFQKEPSRTLNASECTARGCALQCAMLSPTFRVRDFEVQDANPFPIALSWKLSSASPEGVEGEEAAQPNQIVFTKNNPLPSSKLLTFYRNDTFTIDAFYADLTDLPPGADPKIGTFTIGPFPPLKNEDTKPKLKVKIRLNLHGVLSMEAATLLEEDEVDVPVAKSAPAVPMDTEDKAEAAAGVAKEESMEDAVPQANGDKMETEPVKAESGKKKKTKRTDIPIQASLVGGLPPVELQKAQESEYEMALQDRVMEETKDKKNSVEAYVYSMRNKLSDKLATFVTDGEKSSLSAKLQETEDWLYEDGEDETKGVYSAKLDELKKIGDPIELRQREQETRGPAVDALVYCISSFRDAALSRDPKYDHIDNGDKEKVVVECNKADAWLREKQQQQAPLPKTANPVLLTGDIRKKAEALDRFCKPIMTKPRPAVPKKDTAPEPKPEEAKKAEPEPMETETGPSPPKDDGESMQTE